MLGKLAPKRRADCAALAGESTLNRLELHEHEGGSRYHKIRPQADAVERLWVDLFLDAHAQAPRQIVLDLDATEEIQRIVTQIRARFRFGSTSIPLKRDFIADSGCGPSDQTCLIRLPFSDMRSQPRPHTCGVCTIARRRSCYPNLMS